MKKEIKFYTDYPLGDSRGELVEVKLLSWTRDKYVKVEYKGEVYGVKRAYIYSGKDSKGDNKYPDLRWFYFLPYSVEDRRRTKLEASKEYKKRVNINVSYEFIAYSNDGRRVEYSATSKSLKESLRLLVNKLRHDPYRHYTVEINIKGRSYTSYPFLGVEELRIDDTFFHKKGRAGNLSKTNLLKLLKELKKIKKQLKK